MSAFFLLVAGLVGNGFMQVALNAESSSLTFQEKLSQPLPPAASLITHLGSSSKPVAYEDPSEVYVNLNYLLYTNHYPVYYEQSSVEATPYTTLNITRNGQKVFQCRNDWPIYDTCSFNSSSWSDNNITRGSTYEYSIHLEQFDRSGTFLKASPLTSSSIYVGTENSPRMKVNMSYRDKIIGPYTSALPMLVPANESLTLSWQPYDGAGLGYAGDPPRSCEVQKNGTVIADNIGSSGSITLNVGGALGKSAYAIACYNLAGPNPSSWGDTVTVVDALPPNYYGESKATGGGGVAIAVPEATNNSGDLDGNGVTDKDQPNLVNLFSAKSNTYLSMEVDGCGVASSGFDSSGTGEADTGFKYPFGILSFTLNCKSPGDTAKITKHYYTDIVPDDAVLRKYNSRLNTHSQISDATIVGTTVQGKKALVVSYSVTDGGPLDEDGEANAIIVDPVGLAVAGTSALSQPAGEPCKGGSFLGLVPWYNYLDVSRDLAGVCVVKNFQILPNGSAQSDIPLVLLALVDSALRLAGLIAIGYIIYGGIQYVISQGKPDATAKAQTTIFNSLIGLVIAISALAIIMFLAGSIN